MARGGLDLVSLDKVDLQAHLPVTQKLLQGCVLLIPEIGFPGLQTRLARSQKGLFPAGQSGHHDSELPGEGIEFLAPQKSEDCRRLPLGTEPSLPTAPARGWVSTFFFIGTSQEIVPNWVSKGIPGRWIVYIRPRYIIQKRLRWMAK